MTVLAYLRVGEGGFVNLDDDAYVEHQPLVNQGFSAASVAWAFTGVHSNNWHPLTTLSHQLDCELFGVRPGPMHWENLGWHVLNTLLVYFVWRALTNAVWRSALVAALFALHPLHVESVAWISERKDVLSAFFWLLGIWTYAHYVRRPTRGRYALVAGLMVLALLAKPMAVTFPCALLLLDYWPLHRWPTRSWRQLAVEKLPMFVLVALHSGITFIVQHDTGAGQFGERFSLWIRIGNGIVSYVRYAGKTLWPESLSPMYFHPGAWPIAAVLGAAVLLLVISGVIVWLRHTRPWLVVGWLWFLGTLMPVIGLIQVGAQAMADRYMYVPILGLLTMCAWEGGALISRELRARPLILGGVCAILAGLTVITFRQVGAWKNSITLYHHSIAVGENNPAVHYLLAVALRASGQPPSQVEAHFRRALELQPNYVNALTQLALIALLNQRFDDARALIEESIRREPSNAALRVNLGAFWVRMNRLDLATPHFEEALRLDPKLVTAHLELGQIFANQNRFEQALVHYEARARRERWNPDALAEYGTLLANMRQFEAAKQALERSLWIRPNAPAVRANLDLVEQLMRAKG